MIYNNSQSGLAKPSHPGQSVTMLNQRDYFFCKHWTEICKQLFTFRKSVIGLCPKVIIWMAFYGAVAGCTLEKKYEHDNTRTMNLIRNFLQFLLFYKSDFYQRENTNWEALFQLEKVVRKSKLMLESANAFWKFDVGDINVDVGCWRRNVLATTWRCERRNIQRMSPTYNSFQQLLVTNIIITLKLEHLHWSWLVFSFMDFCASPTIRDNFQFQFFQLKTLQHEISLSTLSKYT